MSDQHPVFCTPREAQTLLGVDRRTLYAMVDAGTIRAWQSHTGGWHRYYRSDIEAILQGTDHADGSGS